MDKEQGDCMGGGLKIRVIIRGFYMLSEEVFFLLNDKKVSTYTFWLWDWVKIELHIVAKKSYTHFK